MLPFLLRGRSRRLVENRDYVCLAVGFKDVGITGTIAAPYCTPVAVSEHRQQRRLWRACLSLHF